MGTDNALRGADIIEALESSGIEIVAALPDIVTSAGLLWPLASHSTIRLVRVCKEDEGISICAAMSYCDKRALLLMQHTGLFDSINALRHIAVEYSHPICMMVGLQGIEPGVIPSESNMYSVHIVEPILDVMGVEHQLLREAGDVAKIGPAIDRAYGERRPVVMLVGQSPEAP